ncbi:hypothetical protein A2415_03680 [candidate division WWE3 bacterium RIFOXYC1_FULL_39_7]|uniref:Uncharacterized protein n=2 Tax=Katanobacteria TaxID=422282 RepID=A0A1F4X7Q5_UNCKA|nr:MAG: hypothetical protein A2415_03680 [candidate division WWE3 bacterium RIFOXYC1_FULL_39_7]OGC77707.1 MAG: hypothetical protein A2619_03305 [candidate division WWE3 bacterium RIFOXYD1_FULL_39_9]
MNTKKDERGLPLFIAGKDEELVHNKKGVPLFVCHKKDSLALKCLEILKASKVGCLVRVLNEGQLAPVGSIAIYDGTEEITVNGEKARRNDQWPSRHMRVAAHRTYERRPHWAESTPFVVPVRTSAHGSLQSAVLEMATMYTRWFRGEAGVTLPWETWNGQRTTKRDLMESWLDLVQGAVGKEALGEIMASHKIPEKYQDRGGAIVFNHFPVQRIVMDGEHNAGKASYVSFGTSSLASPHDFVQALKSAAFMRKPLRFFTYGAAYNAGRHLSERLLPSLQIFGDVDECALNTLLPKDRWGEKPLDIVMDPIVVREAFRKLGLNGIASTAAELANCDMAEWYRRALGLIGVRILADVKTYADFSIFEEDLPDTNANMKVSTLAQEVQEALGHSGNILNGPNGENVPSDLIGYSTLADTKLERLFSEGWWLGGASIYYLWFKNAEIAPFVAMVNDGDWGKVNLVGRKWTQSPYDLHVLPVGYFRIYPRTHTGVVHHVAIDPWVLLELHERWGTNLTRMYNNRLWNALEVPLHRENVGKRTYVEVGESEFMVRVVEPDNRVSS